MRKPDFFIVGAPKCGTTAIYYYLAQHPEVFLPYKEVNFFGSDLYFPDQIRDESKYLDLFASARTELRVGEVSVWYLYSKTAAAEIKRLFPDASIVIILRNPVEMLYSLHSQLLYSGVEDIQDFAGALRAAANLGRRLPLWNGPPVMNYWEAAKYSPQLKRYLDTFGREKVKVIIFDDFRTDTLKSYQELCRFLGVNSSFEPELRVINPNKTIRSKGLRSIMQSPPIPLRVMGRLLRTRTRHKLSARIQELNTRYEHRPPISEELRRELQLYFVPDVEDLSKLLDRDLTHWCRS